MFLCSLSLSFVSCGYDATLNIVINYNVWFWRFFVLLQYLGQSISTISNIRKQTIRILKIYSDFFNDVFFCSLANWIITSPALCCRVLLCTQAYWSMQLRRNRHLACTLACLMNFPCVHIRVLSILCQNSCLQEVPLWRIRWFSIRINPEFSIT